MLKAGEVFEIAILTHNSHHRFRARPIAARHCYQRPHWNCNFAAAGSAENAMPVALQPHPRVTTATASSDNIITVVSSCNEATGCTRQRAILSLKEIVAS